MPYQPKTHKKPNSFAKKSYQVAYDATRGTSNQRGYDNSWRTVRMQHLLNHPLCEDCLKNKKYEPATDVHHIKKLADNKNLRDVSENLMSLCHSCHSVRTANGE